MFFQCQEACTFDFFNVIIYSAKNDELLLWMYYCRLKLLYYLE